MKLKLYFTDLKIADIKARQAKEALNEDPYNKKKYAEYKKMQKKQTESFNKFADEFSKFIEKERSDKFDLYIRTRTEIIEELINMI